LSIFHTFIGKYAKYLLIPILLALVYWIGYNKGKSSALYQAQKQVSKELKEVIERQTEVIDHTTKIDQEIDSSINRTPRDDVRDSCLLSNDPYSKKCV